MHMRAFIGCWALGILMHGAYAADPAAQLSLPAQAATALNGIDAGRIRAHVKFLSDDLLEGLKTLPEENQDPSMPWQKWTWVLPQSTHGTLVEVARPYKAVDGKWVDGS